MPRPMRFSPEVRARVDHCAASSTRASRRCGERSPGGSRHHAPPGAPTSAASPLAECVIGLYKTELIHRRGPWKGIDEVEFATLEWVAWYNTRRLLEPLGYVPPDEFERAYYNRQAASAELPALT
jgi:putative transposase